MSILFSETFPFVRPQSKEVRLDSDDFSDMYHNSQLPSWPDIFADRLFVIKFDFVKNHTTGATILGDNNGFN